jgi:hypothetical protein
MALVQAAPGGQQAAGAIGFDAAAFQREIDLLALRPGEDLLRGQRLDQPVVAAGFELAAPAGEAEIEQTEFFGSPWIRGAGLCRASRVRMPTQQIFARARA